MMAKKANGLTVFITNQEATCAECGEGRGVDPAVSGYKQQNFTGSSIMNQSYRTKSLAVSVITVVILMMILSS